MYIYIYTHTYVCVCKLLFIGNQRLYFSLRYKVKCKCVMGSEIRENSQDQKKNRWRYFKRAGQRILYDDSDLVKTLPCRYQEYSLKDGTDYVPLNLTYSELNSIKSFEKSHSNQTDRTSDPHPLELNSDEEDKSDGIEYAFWQRKSKEYNERLGREPSNVNLWLEFVRFQDKSYTHLFSEDKKDEKKRRVTSKALAERKISILDSAIKKNVRSLELNFERLVVGQDVWDDKKIKQEWSSLIVNFPNKMEVWLRYLAFTQTHFTSFTLPSVVKAFAKCTEKLQQIKSGVFLTHAPPQNLEKCLVDVTLQMAYVWKQAGYMERSIALFQALIEFNLFAPGHAHHRDVTLEARLAMFEPFWDSRAPRYVVRSCQYLFI